MGLPFENNLSVNLLASCFNNTSATYKFYWFISILQAFEKDGPKIPKKILFARMIANAWFTVNYFHVSFGMQDRLQRAIKYLKDSETLMIDDDREVIFNTLSNSINPNTISHLQHFNNQVPHWFLSPWFPKHDKNQIYFESQKYSNQCLYSLFNDHIEINPIWENYLFKNVKVLKEFCYWNLALFLQAKNPNVPDIPNKLIKPAIRSSLINQRKYFWDIVINELGSLNCIYTGANLTLGNYHIEHFIPYSFVTHDLIWNLIPADSSFNIKKSDKLPSLDKYFESFFSIQKSAVEIIKYKSPKNKFLEDYLTIFPDLDNGFTRERFREQILPLITIASNNGFEFL